ncbi:GspH/FimT family pseudopilin [Pseudomonas agarici]|uniref:GspH/FimT family pseudopilin n=1 Tax=Pseudomonas agarici TaxID=46677 RepID=UPI001FC9ADD7|nr:GspH/FimT family pseudopilin [Pseudomonas agarici]
MSELLLGLSLIAILAHLASASFENLMDSQHRRISADELATGLRTARTEAILRQRSVIIHPLDGDWSQGWRIVIDQNGNGHEDPDNPILSERRGDGRTPVRGNTTTRSFIRFTSLGELRYENGSSRGGTLHICAREQAISHRQVVLAATGRVRITAQERPEALCQTEGSEQRTNA